MSAGMEDAVRRAEQDFMRTQDKLQSIRDKLEGSVTKVRSADRMVTITLDMNGFVEAVDFHSQKFRNMAPAQLGSVLAETLRDAQEQARARVLRAYLPLLPAGMPVDGMPGGRKLEQMFEEAKRAVADASRGGHQGKEARK
jgi:DNA-binding protein YbaB